MLHFAPGTTSGTFHDIAPLIHPSKQTWSIDNNGNVTRQKADIIEFYDFTAKTLRRIRNNPENPTDKTRSFTEVETNYDLADYLRDARALHRDWVVKQRHDEQRRTHTKGTLLP